MHIPSCFLALLFFVTTGISAIEPPDAVLVPADAGVVDVKLRYGAKGDGINDDTAALQRAIRETVGRNATVYLPAGTYLVSDTLDWMQLDGVPNAFLGLCGAGRGRTVIRLKDRCPGYGDAAVPKAVVMTRSQKLGGNDGSNQAHENYLMDFAVELGSGNLGAIGIDFMASNTGAMRRIDVRAPTDSGAIGVALTRGFGPGLVQDVRITGCAVGIAITGMIYSATLERIRLEQQREVGLDTRENTVSVSRLTSINRVPAVRHHANQPLTGLLCLLDCSFTGGQASVSAIENSAHLVVRDLNVGGYGSAIRNGTDVVAGPRVKEWLSSPPVTSALGGATTTLRLPVADAPDFHDHDPKHWASVVAAGAVPDDRFDDSEAIQQAIDSGATTVYFPFGTYHLTSPVIIRGKVRKLIGYSARIEGKKAGCDIRLEVPAIIERIDLLGTARFVSASREMATLRCSVSTIALTPEAGGWYCDDVCTGPVTIGKGQRLIARQFNDEFVGDVPGITNHGGSVWILGLKTEGANIGVLTEAGGRSEILGAHVYACQEWRGPRMPAFVVRDGHLAVALSLICHWQPANYDLLLSHEAHGKTVPVPGGGHGAWPLMTAGTSISSP